MDRKVWARNRREAETLLQHHHYRDMPSRSWRFGSLGSDGSMDSTYSYSVTWSPGTLTLAGDISELVVTHYHAMPTLGGAARWMAGANFDYIMGKSDAKQVYERDATAIGIVRRINEPAVDALRGLRHERQRFRRDTADAAAENAGPDEMPRPDDYGMALCWKPGPAARASYREHYAVVDGRYCEPPEGFEGWSRLAEAVGGEAKLILTCAGRRQIKRLLTDHLADGGGEYAAALCSALRLDDYYGDYDYEPQRMLQFVALQRWADHVLREIGDEAAARAGAEPVHA